MMNVNHLAHSNPKHLPAHVCTRIDASRYTPSPLNCNVCDNPLWYEMKAEGRQNVKKKKKILRASVTFSAKWGNRMSFIKH